MSEALTQAGWDCPLWIKYLETGDIPDFAEKGKYETWDMDWNPTGWSDHPFYSGQQKCRYPQSWLPIQCFLAK